jgi:vacuolar protein sorting-associated protein 35
VIKNILQYLVMIFDVVDAVLTMLSSVIEDQSDHPLGEEDPEDFAKEQGLLRRSVLLVRLVMEAEGVFEML